ncbi:hypothetical protein [Candidatus Cryosericum odellii]|jgi:hypothetical protein|uniref:Thioredoxin-like fold domain-containing protein n=1 Tax=Candidatus Cryosericum odellii TaxID=2290917 RepID=A0A398DCQ8_9BACT|nr:hypothetical protein [Candidatus Cryosericum odellii]RIE12915.1 hypothetical protein SMC5_03300 [Candidatus Cryosericum odellii]
MAETVVEIEVYGIWDEDPAASSCGCGGGGCGCATPAQTMGEMFESLRTSLDASDIKERCSLRFIDIIKDSDAQVNQARKMVETGYSLPLTALNGTWSFYGGMSSDLFLTKIREILNGEKEQAGEAR